MDRRLAIDLDLFSRGGMRVLEKIEQQDYNVLARRPAISKFERVGLLLGAACGARFSEHDGRRILRLLPGRPDSGARTSTILSCCFRANAPTPCAPSTRSCATATISATRGRDRAKRSSVGARTWSALAGRYGEHPLWPAFHDSVQRYGIPHEYFYEMIEGVSSDLSPTLQTFDELYRYCYQVASVVGLTIIHIFGFESPDALQLAEKCGIAFQLTNILRDVREDRENGRIYLPEEDIRKFGADLATHASTLFA